MERHHEQDLVRHRFVTGSSRGLGRNFVEAALSRGDQVAATARTTESLDELAAAHGDAVLPLELDVTDKAAVFEGVKRAKEHFGRLDVIVNNAGYAQMGAIEELTEQHLRDQLETNLFGAVWVIQAALPYLREQGAGHIIQLSSAAGLLAMPLGGAYPHLQVGPGSPERIPLPRGRRLRHQGHRGRARRLRHPVRQEPRPTQQRPHGRGQPDLRRPPPAPRGVRRQAARRRPGRRGPGTPQDRRLRQTHPCAYSSARASTPCSSRSTPTGSRPGPTGSTFQRRLTAASIKKLGNPPPGPPASTSPGFPLSTWTSRLGCVSNDRSQKI
ncbi:SDR family NAD(P)-dependent oxidoreductase, partial [Nonomuraea dietziae]|uniref:SDR family NAD(P)-dependent oxidoreductase n=1 Tax=Nonomuraea dietziae TaxID=65515 RepID=UPI0031DE2ECE